MKPLLPLMLMAALSPFAARSETLAERLIASYAPIQSLQCEIRKDTKAGSMEMRKLSRVYFERGDRLHVENVSPVPRRIISDGTNFYSYIEGDPKGYAAPVAKLESNWLLSLRQVPGTAMDHLLRLVGVAEEELPPAEGLPVRRGYAAAGLYAVLSVDDAGRLVRVEFYTSADRVQQTARYDYSAFEEVLPGVWIPMQHRATLAAGKETVEETTRVVSCVVNQPIAANLFIAAPFFPGVRFTDSFEDIYNR